MSDLSKIDPILANLEDMEYIEKERLWVVTNSLVINVVKEDLKVLYAGEDNAKSIILRVGRQMKAHYLSNRLCWPEDVDKKEFLIITVEREVRVLRDAMVAHIESVILTRRDLLLKEHGVDLDGGALIEDFDRNMEMYAFDWETRNIFNRSVLLSYKNRIDQVIDDLGVGY